MITPKLNAESNPFTTVSPPAQRHFLEVSCPEGNSKNIKASSHKITGHSSVANQISSPEKGKVVGRLLRLRLAYWTENIISSTMKPNRQNNQPIGFLGW